MRGVLLIGLLALTQPSGNPIWVAREHIISVRPASSYECSEKGKTIVGLDSAGWVCVQEPATEVARKLEQTR